jgi:hypothetical protein
MPEIILHFEASGDAEATAVQLQQRVATLPGVEAAEAEASRSRGVVEIILTLQLAAALFGGAAGALDQLKRMIESGKGVWHALGLGQPKVEVGMERVAPDALTETHAKELVSHGGG